MSSSERHEAQATTTAASSDTPRTDALDRFRELVRHHDVTYNYSDDGAVWRSGQAERDEIMALAAELPDADVMAIWNENIDRVISEPYRKNWYWSGK